MGKLAAAADFAKIIESAAAVGALIVGGWWFFEQRENHVRADVSQVVQIIPIQQGLFAIETNVSVKNEGKRQLKLHRAKVMLQGVSAAPYHYEMLPDFQGAAYWRANRPFLPDQDQFQDGELRWPVLRAFNEPIDHHIEPEETDNLVFTFLTRCSDLRLVHNKPISLLRVATDIIKPESEEGKEFAWKVRSFVDITKECAK